MTVVSWLLYSARHVLLMLFDVFHRHWGDIGLRLRQCNLWFAFRCPVLLWMFLAALGFVQFFTQQSPGTLGNTHGIAIRTRHLSLNICLPPRGVHDMLVLVWGLAISSGNGSAMARATISRRLWATRFSGVGWGGSRMPSCCSVGGIPAAQLWTLDASGGYVSSQGLSIYQRYGAESDQIIRRHLCICFWKHGVEQ